MSEQLAWTRARVEVAEQIGVANDHRLRLDWEAGRLPALAPMDTGALIALIVDALEVYVGRDIDDIAIAPTMTGVVIQGFAGRDWALRLVPEGSSGNEAGAA